MKLAAIWGYPGATRLTSGYHMALGQELVRDSQYLGMYRTAHARGDFIIVDNGAAEPLEERVNFEKILPIALSLADEIIMPDVLGDRVETAKEHKYWAKWIPARYRMIVPQGKDSDEWLQSFTELEEELEGDFVSVGIPKICEKFEGGRVDLCNRIRKCCSDRDYWFHALGVYHDPIVECTNLRQFDFVRGIDTGAVIAWAQHKEKLGTPVTGHYSLDWYNNSFEWALVYHNFCALQAVCNAHSH